MVAGGETGDIPIDLLAYDSSINTYASEWLLWKLLYDFCGSSSKA
jgi:hypothetical protein